MDRLDLRLSVSSPGGLGDREWMIANGLAGYASGRLDGSVSRRHDGLLVAALPVSGRTILLDRVEETVIPADGTPPFALFDALVEVRLERGLPVWRFARDGVVLERRVVMPWRQNTTLVSYRLLSGGPEIGLDLRPWMHFRGNDGPADQPLYPSVLSWLQGGRIEVTQGAFPPLRLAVRATSPSLILGDERTESAFYPIEAERDYTAHGPVWSPGRFSLRVGAAGADLIASAEPWAAALAQTADEAWAAETGRRDRLIAHAVPAVRDPVGRQLVQAADAFLFEPRGRFDLAARALAQGVEVRSVIAGYPWFNDWGRDTMIALEGLTLVTGRPDEARRILRTFAAYERDGLIPNNIPDGGTEGVYHAADASLWFFHALDRYLTVTGDTETLDLILPVLRRILDAHRVGTRFGIGIDPADGLLRQGAEGYMLTWMDSATPRRGKAVEINALWHNALAAMAGWLDTVGDAGGAAQARDEAARVRESFNRRFWNPQTGFLFDLIDGEAGDDPDCRCNQLLALSLPHPVLEPAHWAAVLAVVETRLLTPFGLRSLDPAAPDYRPSYAGDLRSRDFAYHRGTVWAWLIGPFVDAWLKVHPGDRAGARRMLSGLAGHLDEFCVGTIAEVFDGDPPHRPRGCTAQAWSVAEMLRAWANSAP